MSPAMRKGTRPAAASEPGPDITDFQDTSGEIQGKFVEPIK